LLFRSISLRRDARADLIPRSVLLARRNELCIARNELIYERLRGSRDGTPCCVVLVTGRRPHSGVLRSAGIGTHGPDQPPPARAHSSQPRFGAGAPRTLLVRSRWLCVGSLLGLPSPCPLPQAGEGKAASARLRCDLSVAYAALACGGSSAWNWSSSVDPFSAVVDD